MKKIAIIGAGLAGLTAANILQKQHDVVIFEKSRGVGGRVAHRRAGPYSFDHGAQFFTVKSRMARDFIRPMLDQGIIQPWCARFVEYQGNMITNQRQWDSQMPHYVGTPSMNDVAKFLAKDLQIQREVLVQSIEKQGSNWQLTDDGGHDLGIFDWVIITAPSHQAANLIPQQHPFCAEIEAYQMMACFSLMLGFEKPLPLEFDAALVRGADISWISVNSAKPGRNIPFSLLVHSTNKWADLHIDDDRLQVVDYLCQQTSRVIGHDVSVATHKDIHGWRYANIKKMKGKTHLIDHQNQIAICGDWFIQGRIESAINSAIRLARVIEK